jgi:hypothetical protein
VTSSNPWKVIHKPERNLSVRRVNAEHPFNLFWAKDFEDQYIFLIKIQNQNFINVKWPSLIGIEVKPISDPQSSEARLLLLLKEKDNADIFHTLCIDLAESTVDCKSESALVSRLYQRLNRWQFFLRVPPSGILKRSDQKGLIGELHFLYTHLFSKFDLGSALNSWKGPIQGAKDFLIGGTAIEVKAVSASLDTNVKISSLQQLDDKDGRLFLFAAIIKDTDQTNPDSIDLPSQIDLVADYIAEHAPDLEDGFLGLITKVGYRPDPEYKNFRFLYCGEVLFEVKEGFPRLVSEDLSPGITRAKYTIGLEYCQDFLTEFHVLEDSWR